MGRGKGLNLTLNKIRLSRKQNNGATNYKIKTAPTSPTFPYSSDVDGKQLSEKILDCNILVSRRTT